MARQSCVTRTTRTLVTLSLLTQLARTLPQTVPASCVLRIILPRTPLTDHCRLMLVFLCSAALFCVPLVPLLKQPQPLNLQNCGPSSLVLVEASWISAPLRTWARSTVVQKAWQLCRMFRLMPLTHTMYLLLLILVRSHLQTEYRFPSRHQ